MKIYLHFLKNFLDARLMYLNPLCSFPAVLNEIIRIYPLYAVFPHNNLAIYSPFRLLAAYHINLWRIKAFKKFIRIVVKTTSQERTRSIDRKWQKLAKNPFQWGENNYWVISLMFDYDKLELLKIIWKMLALIKVSIYYFMHQRSSS